MYNHFWSDQKGAFSNYSIQQKKSVPPDDADIADVSRRRRVGVVRAECKRWNCSSALESRREDDSAEWICMGDKTIRDETRVPFKENDLCFGSTPPPADIVVY